MKIYPLLVLSCFHENFYWQTLTGPFKEKARHFFIKRAEQKNIPWTALSQKYRSVQPALERIQEGLQNKNLTYPSYFLQPFHGYEDGNMNWDAACENEASTLSISSHYWTNLTVQESALTMRENFLEKLVDRSSHVETILDVGCSIGISTDYVTSAFPGAMHIYGVDLSPYFLSIAQWNLNQKNRTLPNVIFSHQNAESLSFSTESIDVVTCCFLFHEVPKNATITILQELKRVLRSGGTLGILDLSPALLKKKLRDNYLRRLFFESTEPHIYDYYQQNITQVLERLGFENVQESKNDPFNAVWLANKEKGK